MIEPYLADTDCTLYHGGCLEILQELLTGSASACVTSPPYLDARPEYPAAELLPVFREVMRVIEGGPLLVNVGRLWREGVEVLWWADLLELGLRDTLLWVKPNANPLHGQVLANSHEYVLLFGEGFDTDAVRTPYAPESLLRMQRAWRHGTAVKGAVKEMDGREPNPLGARPKSYIAIETGKEKGNPHPAPMALDLARHLVRLSGGTTILDPFAGSGTTALAAREEHCRSLLIELSEDYCELIAERLQQQSLFA